jgi:hypothetical protein
LKSSKSKEYPTIACCGIDCGLCPSYYIKGPSRCPGCGGLNFFNKHPSCSILTCCLKKDFEICADCNDFPCDKIKIWDEADSFVTHKVCIKNLESIKEKGIKNFLEQQYNRMQILEKLLLSFNDGRSKSFFCIATALLSQEDMERILKEAEIEIKRKSINLNDIKFKSKLVKKLLLENANEKKIELKLRKKTN